MIENSENSLSGNQHFHDSEDSLIEISFDMDESNKGLETSSEFDFTNSTQTTTPTPTPLSESSIVSKSRKRKAKNDADQVKDAFINNIHSISNNLLKEKDEDDEDTFFVKSIAQQMKKMGEDNKVDFKIQMLKCAHEAVKNSH